MKLFILSLLIFAFGCSSDSNNPNNSNNVNNVNNGDNGLNGAVSCDGEVRDYDPTSSDGPLLQYDGENIGENCASGGQRLERGTDADADEKLSADEIEETIYSCDTRFPHAGFIRFYRLDDTYCSSTDSVLKKIEKQDPVADPKLIISPHAGWQFSGINSVTAFSRVEVPEVVIILGNNHFDRGTEKYAVYDGGAWSVPTGDVEVDEEVAAQLIADVDLFKADRAAHSREHSIEVQVMWLHRFQPNLKVVPIAIDNNSDYEELKLVGEQLAASLDKLDKPYLVVATTDMSHFDPIDVAKDQDDQMIEKILDRDPEGLFDLVSPQKGVMSMCALEPVVVGLVMANAQGATESELVMRRYSSEETGNEENVVGYQSSIFY